jgi:uncharacterized protein DUF6265
MMKRIRFSSLLATAAALLLSWPALAGNARGQQAAGAGSQPGAPSSDGSAHPIKTEATRQQSAPLPPSKPALADFAWLEGRWRGEWGLRVAEQTWLAPKAGEMAGLFRLVEGDKTLVLEVFTLVENPEGTNFYLRHFTPELVPWEKSDATLLKLDSLEPNKMVFVNPLNGEPKHVMLIRVDADTYTARSEIEPEQGEPKVIEITYHREKLVPATPSGGSGARRKKP